MKKLILIFLLCTVSASAQFPMVSGWNSAVAEPPPETVITNQDSLKGYWVSSDIGDTLSRTDTTYIWPNRAKWTHPTVLGDLYQLTGAQKPIYKPDSMTLVFDGIDDFMNTSVGNYSQPSTIFIVYRWVSNVDKTGFVYDGFYQYGCLGFYDNRGSQCMYAGTGFCGPGPSIPPSTLVVQTSVWNSGASILRQNGLQFTGGVSSHPLKGFTLARRYDGLNPTNISVRAIIIVHEALSTNHIANIEAYLADKYGVTLP